MIKKLAGQTAIYGIPSIVGRLINFLLIFVFTHYFSPALFSTHAVFYAYAAFFLVILPHGMETGFFNFSRKNIPIGKVFTTSIISVFVVSTFFLIAAIWFRREISAFMLYPTHPEYVSIFAFILYFDVLAMLPFAFLRYAQRARYFALIRSAGIILNVGFTLLFVVYFPRWSSAELTWYYQPGIDIGYVFIANLIGSTAVFLLLLPTTIKQLGRFDEKLWKEMFKYAWPLLFVGLAGIVNETLDRAWMGRLLQSNDPQYDIGVYSAFYRLSIVITIFIQAFRYAAEPFFFERSGKDDAKKMYAMIMDYFVWACLTISIIILLFLEPIAHFAISKNYFDHPQALEIVPVLLLANIFLGISYNLGIWYKIQEKNNLGALIAIIGALVSVCGLWFFVPEYGIIAAAFTTLAAYFTIALLSYWMGQKYYAIPYRVRMLLLMFVLAFLVYYVDRFMVNGYSGQIKIIAKTGLLISFLGITYRLVIRVKKT